MHEQFVDKSRAVLPTCFSNNAGETSGAGNMMETMPTPPTFKRSFFLVVLLGFHLFVSTLAVRVK